MKVAIDVSPITSGHYLQHRVRGTGFYLNNLKDALLDKYGEEGFVFTKRGDRLDDKIDLIHYPYFEPFFLTLPVRKVIKTIITVHDLTPLVFKNDFPVGVKGFAKWQIQKKVLRSSNLIITDSNSSKKDIQRLTGLDGNKIRVIYLAAADYFKPVSNEKKQEILRKFNLPDKFVLYVGDATPNKNLSRLVQAVNNTNLSLVIVGQAFKDAKYDKGNAWNKDLIKAQLLASKNKNIASLGFVDNNDLVGLYNAATVLVMPSLYEGFGFPVLEAMQSGCPVITSRCGSLSEVAGDGAMYIDPLDTDSITSAIKKIFSNEDLRKSLIEKGLKNASKFTWDKTAVETYRAYKDVLKE